MLQIYVYTKSRYYFWRLSLLINTLFCRSILGNLLIHIWPVYLFPSMKRDPLRWIMLYVISLFALCINQPLAWTLALAHVWISGTFSDYSIWILGKHFYWTWDIGHHTLLGAKWLIQFYTSIHLNIFLLIGFHGMIEINVSLGIR